MTKLVLYGAAVLGVMAAVTGTLYYTYSTGYTNGHNTAKQEAREATDRAISKLADNAESAHVAHDLCIDSGRVWAFSTNQCTGEGPE